MDGKEHRILNKVFNMVNFLERHIFFIGLIVSLVVLVFLFYMAVLFGLFFIITLLFLLIVFFDHRQIKKSVKFIFIFLFITGLFCSPLIVSITFEKYRFDNPELIIDNSYPELSELTQEFQSDYSEIDFGDPHIVLESLQEFIYSKYPYDYGHPYIFPKTYDVLSGENSDCRGRALIGYSILKNLGFDVYIVGGLVDGPHTYIRIYQNDTFFDGFLMSDGRPNFEPAVIFNENESIWDSPFRQLYGALFHGFYCSDFLILFISSLFFLLPISALAIFILLLNRNKNYKNYLFVVLIALLICICLCLICNINQTLIPILFIIIGGIYLRILSLKFPFNKR
jgi:hypothetical protein